MTAGLYDLIAAAAAQHGLDPALVAALVQQESRGDGTAYNPEPHYRYLWNVRTRQPFRPLTLKERRSEEPPLDFPTLAGDRDQEWWAQQASWGLCQVMGATARELGCKAPYLTILVRDDALNLDLGCRYLAAHLKRAGGNLRKALGAYNAGWGGADGPRGTAYAGEVLARVHSVPRT